MTRNKPHWTALGWTMRKQKERLSQPETFQRQRHEAHYERVTRPCKLLGAERTLMYPGGKNGGGLPVREFQKAAAMW